MGTIKNFVPAKASEQPDALKTLTSADDVKDLNVLKKFLCTLAVKRGGGVNVDSCRECESQCAYGRRFIELWDDALYHGVDPETLIRRCGRRKQAEKAQSSETVSAAPAACETGEVEARLSEVKKQLQAEQAKALTLTINLKGAMDANQELAAEVEGLRLYETKYVQKEQEANQLRVELTSQRQLTEDMQAGMTALVEENKQLLKRAQDAEQRIQQENAEFAALELEVIKLKAKLWDAYHSEE